MSDQGSKSKFRSSQWKSYMNDDSAQEDNRLPEASQSNVMTISKPEDEQDTAEQPMLAEEVKQPAKNSSKKKNRRSRRAAQNQEQAKTETAAESDAVPQPDAAVQNIEPEKPDMPTDMARPEVLPQKPKRADQKAQAKQKRAKAKAKELLLAELQAENEKQERIQQRVGGDSRKDRDPSQAEYTWDEQLHRNLYYIGVQLMRKGRNLRRRLRVVYGEARKKMRARAQLSQIRRKKWQANLHRSMMAPFREVRRQYLELSGTVKQARAGGRPAQLRALLQCAGELAYGSRKAVRTIFNYVFPLAAFALLMSTIAYFGELNYALMVEYAGKSVGYVQDESIFENAQKMMMERIVNESYISPADTVPKFKISVVDETQMTNVEDLADEIIGASGNILEEADGLYVADRFMGAVKNGNALLTYLDSIKAENSTGDKDEQITFIKSIKLRKGLYPVSSVVPLADVQQRLQGDEQVQRVYTAVAGDSPSVIADKNEVPLAQLRQLNPEIDTKLLPGQQILVAKSVPFLGIQVTRTEEYTEEIPFKTNVSYDSRYFQGYRKVSSAGKKGESAVVARITYVDGVEVSRDVLSKETMREPVAEEVVEGTQKPLTSLPSGGSTSGSFIWPVGGSGGYFNGSLGSYWGHTGMDIAGIAVGTDIRASMAGRVVLASSVGAYGRHIMIDHGNGVQTLYAHNSVLYVGVGDYVAQGQVIAGAGRTGRATGVHCHFEIRVNGRYMDPVKYIGTRR